MNENDDDNNNNERQFEITNVIQKGENNVRREMKQIK